MAWLLEEDVRITPTLGCQSTHPLWYRSTIGVVPIGTKKLAGVVNVGRGEVVKVPVLTGTKSIRLTHHH